MTEFHELVKEAPNFNAMERGELVTYAYAMFAAGTKADSENAKLRELVQTLAHCLNDVDCDKCPLNGNPYELRGEWAACDALLDYMRELGVEVSGSDE